MNWSKIAGVSCLVSAVAVIIHHFIICGRWYDLADLLHHELFVLLLAEAGVFLIFGNFEKAKSFSVKAKNWVFSHPITVLRYGFFLVGAWQLDILCANLLFPHRHEPFYFWIGSVTFWDAYAIFFWTLAIGFFIPEIVKFLWWLWRKYMRFL